jgi:hypothetical protein
MAVVRRAFWAAFAAVSAVGCALFSDFGGLSSGTDPDAGALPEGGDTGTAGDSGNDGDLPPLVDAGPDAPAYELAVLADKPIAYWPFDDAPGSAFVSEIVGNKKADFSGTLTFGVPGVSGTCIDKTDVEQVLEVGDYFDFVGFNPYTIEVWAKPKFQSQYLTMIAKRRPNTPFGWNFYFHRVNVGDTPGFQLEHVSPDGGNRTVFVETPDAEAKFHHIVVTYDPKVATGAPMRMYYDGVRTDGFDDDVPASDTTEPVWIGQAFTGLLDEIALYDHALPVERVQAHYLLGKK